MTQLAIHLSKSCQTIKGHKQFTLKQKHISVETTAIHKHEKNSSTISLVALNNSSASQLAYQKTKGNTNTEDRHSKSAKTKFLNSQTAYKNTILSNHLFQTSTFSNSGLLAAGFKTQQIPTTLGWHAELHEVSHQATHQQLFVSHRERCTLWLFLWPDLQNKRSRSTLQGKSTEALPGILPASSSRFWYCVVLYIAGSRSQPSAQASDSQMVWGVIACRTG